jgi:hypothetical protein
MTKKQTISLESANTFRKRWISFRAMWHQTDLRWKRLNSYKKITDQLREELSVNTLRGMLDRLSRFADDQYWFFYNGLVGASSVSFADVGSDANLDPRFSAYQSEYSIGDYVLSETFNRAAYDLQILDRAIDQRYMAITTVDWELTNWQEQGIDADLSISKAINMADELAIGAMMMFKGSFALDRFATAITYTWTTNTSRVIPYADVALIGLPISVLGNQEDVLAIPHEVGHFLFWNGKKTTVDPFVKTTKRQK